MDINSILEKRPPKLRFSFHSFRWQMLFLLDQLFGFSLKKKNAQGKTLQKQKNPSFIGRCFQKIHAKAVKKLMKEKAFESEGPIAIIEMDINDFTHSTFKRWKDEVNEPVVVRGFLDGAPIMELTKEENLISKLGDVEVQCVNLSVDNSTSSDGRNVSTFKTNLRDYLTLDKFNNYYVNNFHGILNKMDFYRLCKGREIRKIQKNGNALNQWFIKRGALVRSSLHCANGENIFLNIQGKKEWHFIHPSYTPLIHATLSKYGVYAVSDLTNHHEKGDFYDLMCNAFPYFKHIPVYKVTLQPGDLLYNPPWWWHDVRNLSPLTVGCATRWVEPLKIRSKLITNSPVLFAGQVIEFLKNPKKSSLYKIGKSVNNGEEAGEFINSIFSSEWEENKKVSV
ncbi:Cupin-like domain-containing protein [Ekhidna lutea]|uniref:Cupin-like domain-containing protein n=1 Tax=Ekhidna lutea TaxID=447679 RepID=A0A239FTL1_EKHLU|nr:cupin-like domain-containing protein [Ekhidna lutea]SNS59492.1 Cupin-like domain-containing protein [Ekhidna lutea]